MLALTQVPADDEPLNLVGAVDDRPGDRENHQPGEDTVLGARGIDLQLYLTRE